MPPSGDRSRSSGASLLTAALALLAGLAMWAGCGRIASCGASFEAPDTQIRKALARQDRAHLADLDGLRGGGTVELYPIRFADVTPSVEGDRAAVVAMLSADGRVLWRDQEAKLAYVGKERFHMKPCAIALWCVEGDQFERLRGVLAALLRRHDAFQRRDVEGYARLLAATYQDRGEDRASALRRVAAELATPGGAARVVSWQIRVGGWGAEVGEDVDIATAGTEPRRERHVYRLQREGDRWSFAGGV